MTNGVASSSLPVYTVQVDIIVFVRFILLFYVCIFTVKKQQIWEIVRDEWRQSSLNTSDATFTGSIDTISGHTKNNIYIYIRKRKPQSKNYSNHEMLRFWLALNQHFLNPFYFRFWIKGASTVDLVCVCVFFSALRFNVSTHTIIRSWLCC